MKKAALFKMIPFIVLLCLLIGISCSASQKATSFTRISMEEAKKMMELDDGHVIVDVRTEEEYSSGHIPGAICIPNETIYKDRPSALPDLDQVILIYCRSGNRSKRSARMLYEMGYTNVYEFGGIIDWDGEIETGRTLLTFSVYRYGEIRYDSYSIFLDEDGYHILVNDEEPQSMDEETVQKLMDVIEAYNVSSWDGFDKTNENVLDGEGFSLEIGFTDGTSVKALGDNAFPDQYADAMGEMWDILTHITEE